MKSDEYVIWHDSTVTRGPRELLNGRWPINLSVAGISDSGKSTLAFAVWKNSPMVWSCRTFVFDGSNVKRDLCGDLGFSLEDREVIIRCLTEGIKLFLAVGMTALTAFFRCWKNIISK
jgi:adenylylsulfate kinase